MLFRSQNYEAGRVPSNKQLLIMANRIGTTVDALLGRVSERTPESAVSGHTLSGPASLNLTPINSTPSGPSIVRESTRPFGAQPSPTEMFSELRDMCANLDLRMSSVEKLLIQLLAKQNERKV